MRTGWGKFILKRGAKSITSHPKPTRPVAHPIFSSFAGHLGPLIACFILDIRPGTQPQSHLRRRNRNMCMKKVKPSLLSLFSAVVAFCVAAASAYTLEGMPGTLFSPSAQPLNHLGLVISAGAFGHQDESMVQYNRFLSFKDTSTNPQDPDTFQVQDLQSASFRLNVAMGFGGHFDVGISAPFYGDFISDTEAKSLSGVSFGDPTFSAKGSYTLGGDHVFDIALLATLTMPLKTGKGFLPKQGGYMPDSGSTGLLDTLHPPLQPRFFSSYHPGGSARALMTLDLTRLQELPWPFRASLGAGVGQTGADGADSRFLLGGGLEWLAMPSLAFFINSQSETRLSKAGKLDEIGKEYSYATVGFAAQGDDGIFFSVNVQKSLPSPRPFRTYDARGDQATIRYAARYQPRLALAANLGWSGTLVAADEDKDGIPDRDDVCPKEKEDMDGFQDMDGCPEIDNDGDSVNDVMDKCPTEAEDLDGFQDDDGCPETDNDKDGLPDGQDKCMNEPEDMDGFEDYDGCPELDNDKDGIQDAQDKCPTIPEDLDKFEDTDGCPEPDNDQDKIPDLNDKCPDEPESYNGFEDGDGCPDMSRSMLNSVPLEKRTLLKGIHFLGNSADLLPESYASLDTLAERIRGIPGVMLEVRGYWDAAGGELDGFRNSESRAIAVRKYLVGKGVDGNQILARGMGSRDPIGNNKTAAGRLQNRRVELHKLN
jgi:outer membrane protein OmpA-like peptidoglycan-associated protein